jgi:ABC-2 type transport system ATP-binding protein
MNNIDIENVFFSYSPEKPVLKGLNISVKPNEIVGLLGANGSGKTTTFKLLSGLLSPDEGNIKVGGVSIFTALEKALKKCAYIPDEPLLYPNFSALENMNLFSILWGVESYLAKTRSEKLLKEVGLWDVRNQWVKSYSRGMKQKLSLCAALLHEPKILLMDEPFTGLDVDALIWAREVLKNYVKEENRSIVFTSHTPEVIESIATRVIILKDGKILHDEFLNELVTSEASLVDTYQKVILES